MTDSLLNIRTTYVKILGTSKLHEKDIGVGIVIIYFERENFHAYQRFSFKEFKIVVLYGLQMLLLPSLLCNQNYI